MPTEDNPKPGITTKPRLARIPQHYYTAGTEFRNYVLSDEDGPGPRVVGRLKKVIQRLAEITGAVVFKTDDPLAAQGWDEERTFVSACRVFHFQIDGTDDPRREECWNLIQQIERAGKVARARCRERWNRKNEVEKPSAPKSMRVCVRRKEPQKGKATEYLINIVSDLCGCVGFALGETVRATKTDELRAGDIGAVLEEDGPESGTFFVGRVLEVSPRHVTIKHEKRTATFFRSKVGFIGRVDKEPVGRWDGPSEAEQKRLDALRGELKRLSKEDDQIIRCSERYRIEKQIFDIEHPTDDPNDWSAWEEGGAS